MFLEVEEILFAPVELRVVADPLDGDDALAGDERLVAAEVERVVHFAGIGGCLEVNCNLSVKRSASRGGRWWRIDQKNDFPFWYFCSEHYSTSFISFKKSKDTLTKSNFIVIKQIGVKHLM